MRYLTAIIFSALFISDLSAQQLAFPTAEGFGRFAKGGRGGRVIEVTNLEDAGAGSLRDCVQQTGPRTCVFKVSGVINLKTCTYCPSGGCINDQISCPWPSMIAFSPYLTIAGQTAPGDGILVKGLIETNSHDMIIRHLRVRPGYDVVNQSGLFIRSDNTILDHVSVGWVNDESIGILGMSGVPVKNVTVQWSLISEALHGIAVGGGYGNPATNISLHHNYFALNWVRNPALSGEGNLDQVVDHVNNVAYIYNDPSTSAPCRGYYHHNYVGNAYIQHAGADYFGYPLRIIGANFDDDRCNYSLYNPMSSIFVNGNIDYYRPSNSISQTANINFDSGPTDVSATRFAAPAIRETDAFQAFKDVIANAGARLPKVDSIDQRALDWMKSVTFQPGNVSRGTAGKIVFHENDVGGYPVYNSAAAPVDTDKDGMPNSFETQYGFNGASALDGNMDKDGDGYTNFEEFLNSTNPLSADNSTVPAPTPTPEPEPTPTPSPITLAVSATAVIGGGSITVTVNNSNSAITDWVALYKVGGNDNNYLSWKYVLSSSLSFSMPSEAGDYEFRLFENNGYKLLAKSPVIKVGSVQPAPTPTPTPAPSGVTITANATSVAPGGSVSLTIQNPNATAKDWVGLFAIGAANGNYLSWKYVSGSSLQFTMPSEAGDYEFRLFQNDGFKMLAKTALIKVGAVTPTPTGGYTLNVDKTTAAPSANVSVIFSTGANAATAKDWVGLYVSGNTNQGGFITWQYTGGKTSGSLIFKMPTQIGTYEFRFFKNDSYKVETTSPKVTVQ